jgi:tetratricopeptide (TPR) repeat protein
MGEKRTRERKYICVCIANLIFLSLISCATIKETRLQAEARKYLIQGQTLLVQGDYEGSLIENQKVLSLSIHTSPEDEALFNMGLIYAHFGNPRKDYKKSLNFFVKMINDYPRSPLFEQAKIWVGVLHENEKLNQDMEKSKQTIEKTKEMIEKTKQLIEKLEKLKRAEPVVEERGEARDHLLRGQKLLAQGDYEGSLAENQKVLALSTHRPPEDEALFNMGLIYAHVDNPKKDYGKSLDYFKRMMKGYPKSPFVEQAKIWMGVLQENEKLNQIIEKSKQVDIEIEEKKREKSK